MSNKSIQLANNSKACYNRKSQKEAYMMIDMEKLVAAQRAYFLTQATKPYAFRM